MSFILSDLVQMTGLLVCTCCAHSELDETGEWSTNKGIECTWHSKLSFKFIFSFCLVFPFFPWVGMGSLTINTFPSFHVALWSCQWVIQRTEGNNLKYNFETGSCQAAQLALKAAWPRQLSANSPPLFHSTPPPPDPPEYCWALSKSKLLSFESGFGQAKRVPVV